MKKMVLTIIWVALLSGISSVLAAGSLCASVQIELSQQLTLERQAFNATLKINNGLTGINLTEVSVSFLV